MIIENIMEEIWQQETQNFQQAYKQAMKMDAKSLYQKIYQETTGVNEGLSTPEFTENIIMSVGCRNRNRNGRLSGCTMCHWETEDFIQQAQLKALQHKEPETYEQLVYDCFTKQRGQQIAPSLIEEIATCNVFDETDFTSGIFNKFFCESTSFSKKPLIGVIAVRADDVTREKVQKWKKQFRHTLNIGFGVETSNNWLRNRWINKNSNNDKISKAIEIINQEGCFSSADVLLGIPGLSSYQYIRDFYTTCKWLMEKNISTILVSPLTSKRRTLQNYIHNYIDQNEGVRFSDTYIQFSGLPSAFDILLAINLVLNKLPGSEQVIQLSPQNGYAFIENYKKRENLTDFEKYFIKEYLELLDANTKQQGLDKTKMLALLNKAKEAPEYKKFVENTLQSDIDIQKSLSWICEQLMLYFKGETIAKEKTAQFKKELKTYPVDFFDHSFIFNMIE